ncbi:hypothetical protein AB0I66_15765 [Streptomyces sp. NPDC050439]|uniref:hypothetical protein n=1 Tax=unclassified Streptomyces TaxID=2593676 RepID=UPI003446CC82
MTQLGGGPSLYSVERHGKYGPDTVGRVRSVDGSREQGRFRREVGTLVSLEVAEDTA